MRYSLVLAGLFGWASLAGTFAACSASGGSNQFVGTGGSGGAGAGGGTDTGSGPSSSASVFTGSGISTGGTSGPCTAGPDEDRDGDGWTINQGDCNDCDPNVNPGAVEVTTSSGTPADEDCDGTVDNVAASCDSGLALDDTDPLHGANAIGLCRMASADGTRGVPGYSWGVLGADYVGADGSALAGGPGLQVGIMPKFGLNVNPQEGENMLVLSSGHARTVGQTGACNKDSCTNHYSATAPSGFPAKVPGCQGGSATPIHDDVALEVALRAPTNATGYKFRFKFNSFEFPEYVCSSYNDQFIGYVQPPPAGALNGNISFDKNDNPVSVNIAFFDVCNATKTHSPCPAGDAELQGTGFEGVWGNILVKNYGGATLWLETSAPIQGGDEFSIRFAIWDTNDDQLDSTVLVDGFEWIANGGTVSVGTGKVPNPN